VSFASRSLTLTGSSGNHYFIQNISKRDVKLFFAQGRQVEVEVEEVEGTSSQFPSEDPDPSPTKRRRSEPYEEFAYDDRTTGGSRAGASGRSYSVAQPRESASPKKRGLSQPVLPTRRR
jgi:hypothetical protein